MLLPLSCVAGAIVSPLWLRSDFPSWSKPLRRGSVAMSLGIYTSGAAVRLCSGQAIVMNSAWILNGGC
jgi:hypothetical protein